MSKFSYTMDDASAVKAIKKAIDGKIAIMKDKGNILVVGAPIMPVNITIQNGIVETSGSLLGKTIVATVDSSIELAEGFEKLS